MAYQAIYEGYVVCQAAAAEQQLKRIRLIPTNHSYEPAIEISGPPDADGNPTWLPVAILS
jgi:hypothetical protein